ncbi:MAG: DUF945 family protein [Thiolinea sp.]
MKKLSGFIILLVVVLAAWAGAGWWIGQQTEQALRQQLTQFNPAQTLVSYERSLLGARAVTRLQVSNVLLKRWLDEVQLVHDIRHGPLIWGGKPVFAFVQWTTRVDQDSLDAETRTALAAAFNDQEPLLAEGTVGFDRQVHIDAQVHPLELALEDSGARLKLDGLEINAQLDPASQRGPLQITGGAVEWSDPDMSITAPALQLEGELGNAGELAGMGRFQLKTRDLAVRVAGATEAMMADIDLQVDASQQAGNLQGKLQLLLDKVRGNPAGIRQFDLALDYAGFNAGGLQILAGLQSRIQELQAQLDWGEDDTELPEGRQQQMQLMMQVQEASARLLETLFNQVLVADQSRVQANSKLTLEQGVVDARADLNYHGTGKPVNFDDLLLQGPKGGAICCGVSCNWELIAMHWGMIWYCCWPIRFRKKPLSSRASGISWS